MKLQIAEIQATYELFSLLNSFKYQKYNYQTIGFDRVIWMCENLENVTAPDWCKILLRFDLALFNKIIKVYKFYLRSILQDHFN